jgi:SAM-dependent methyltransferase
MDVKRLMRPIPGARRASLFHQRIGFVSSGEYWEERYERKGTSGDGSYGELACAKAEFLNTFVREHSVRSVTEFGCGDGNQLSLAEYPGYVGLDVSKAAIGLCKTRFTNDRTKSFFLYDSQCFVDNAGVFSADLALSLDVIYHLVEDHTFEAHMTHLFASASRYVIVYATNTTAQGTAPHVRHRPFSRWVELNCPKWRLSLMEIGPGSGSGRADFFVYERIGTGASADSADVELTG